jgi:hypothetical protein
MLAPVSGVLSSTMAGSMKDALRRSGLAPEEPKPAPNKGNKFREELPDDESLPPRFDPPASTKLHPTPPGPKKP